MEYQSKPISSKVSTIGMVLLAVGIISMVISFLTNHERAIHDYLWMFMFFVSITVGGLGLVALEYLVGATWSTPFRRICEFLAAGIPLIVLLIIPIMLNLHTLYEWTHTEVLKIDPILAGKASYLNEGFFTIRRVIIIGLWILFYFLFTGNSAKQDKYHFDPKYTRRNIKLSTVFGFVFILTLTFTAFDLTMSLEPHWYSTIYGIYYFAGTLVATFAATCLIAVYLYESGNLHPKINSDHFYSLGTLMFGFNIFWAYIAFSQLILIWYGDLPEETIFYLRRWDGPWKYVSLALLFGHFIIPFLVLLPRRAKTNLKRLKIMAIWLLCAHWLDLYWLVMPSYAQPGPIFGWQEIGVIFAAVGLIMIIFKFKSDKQSLVPVGDPKLEHGLNFHLY
jgi:hypothetical protein